MLAEDAIDGLCARAFFDGPAIDANHLMESARQQVAERVGHSVNYEVVLFDPRTGEARDWGYVEQVVAPRLTLFLRAKRLRAEACAPCFLSIFRGGRLWFVAAADFYEHYRQTCGLTAEALAARCRLWEQTGRPAAGLLPG